MKSIFTRFNLIVGLATLVVLTLGFVQLRVRAHEPQPKSPNLRATTTGINPTLSDHRDGPLFLPPGKDASLALGQTLSVKLTNLIKVKGQGPVAIFARVRLSDPQGGLIAQSEEVKIPLRGSYSFKRAALRFPGERGIGRLSMLLNGWVRYEYRSHDRDSEDAYPFIRDARATGLLPVLAQLIDESNGRTIPLYEAAQKKANVAADHGVGAATRSAVATPQLELATQLQFVGQEPYDVNGSKGTRYKLSVTNRSDHPDFLWQPSPTLPPCGKNENAARTWVEIFGSPGDNRLNGFCVLRSSQDLGKLWFAVPAGEKGPQCVYIVMTDRQTGKKYESNRVCSRLFTVVTGRLKGDSPENQAVGWEEDPDSLSVIRPASAAGVTPGSDPKKKAEASKDRAAGVKVIRDSQALGRVTGVAVDPDQTNNKIATGRPDLMIKQFLFPPTNDKALRVHVVNTGKAASGVCRSGVCRLVVTVRKINGVAVGRKTNVTVPALAAGADAWVYLDVKSILPNNVSLQSTTFRLNVDATEIVSESNESNNEVWHGLPATAAIGKAIGGYANDGGEEAASEAEATDTQKLSTEPRERSKLSCRNVSARWQVCGSVSRTRFVAGVGIRFNQLDPHGKRIASRSYEHCSELAADQTIPADIRTQAAGPCKQVLQLAAKEATVQ